MEISDKENLRIWAKQEREKLDMTKLSGILAENLKQSKEYKSAKNIMIFYPLENEVNLLSLLKDKDKKFFLPKIEGKNLLCCPYKDGDKTCFSCFKTCEPLTEPCEKDLIDMIVVPALACDKNGFRLGYGGGFYDRFLNNFSGLKIVCIPQKLIVDTVFPETHDIKVNVIITEKG